GRAERPRARQEGCDRPVPAPGAHTRPVERQAPPDPTHAEVGAPCGLRAEHGETCGEGVRGGGAARRQAARGTLASGLVSYGWPVKPFDQQHPVRGFFGDPRIGSGGGTSFHFGIDVSAPDGTAVYAVIAGTVHLNVAGGPQNIAVTSSGVTHGYWHVQPAVRHGQQIARHALLGHVAVPQAHVHFAERTPGGPYLNPLRRGALAPFVKQHPPTVDRIVAERNGLALDVNALTGVV